MENSFHFFPLWKRRKKGDFNAFQKVRLSGEPRIESGAGAGVKFEAFKKKYPPTYSDVQTIMDLLVNAKWGDGNGRDAKVDILL